MKCIQKHCIIYDDSPDINSMPAYLSSNFWRTDGDLMKCCAIIVAVLLRYQSEQWFNDSDLVMYYCKQSSDDLLWWSMNHMNRKFVFENRICLKTQNFIEYSYLCWHINVTKILLYIAIQIFKIILSKRYLTLQSRSVLVFSDLVIEDCVKYFIDFTVL